MGFYEDITNGKYNLVFIIVLYILVFHQYNKIIKEPFVDVVTSSSSAITNDSVKQMIREIYLADIDAIRNLSNIATKLATGGITIPGNCTISGNLNVQGSTQLTGNTSIVSGNVTLGDQAKCKYQLQVPQNDSGTFSIQRVNRSNEPKTSTGFALISSADGNSNYNYTSLVPAGTIMAYNGSTAPNGWVLCDGTNGTPNLKGRFILGAGSNTSLTTRTLGQTGGAETVTLTVDQIPAHNHRFAGANAPKERDLNGSGGSKTFASEANIEADTNNTGGGKSHENMPPFYVLTYIMKT